MSHELEYIDDEPTIHLTQEQFDSYIQHAKIEALESAAKALNREAIGFQPSWSSSEVDVAKLDGIGKTLDWIKARADKYREILPRPINLRDTYKTLSDGAKIKYNGEIFSHRIGFGDFESRFGDRIVAREYYGEVELISHNLTNEE